MDSYIPCLGHGFHLLYKGAVTRPKGRAVDRSDCSDGTLDISSTLGSLGCEFKHR